MSTGLPRRLEFQWLLGSSTRSRLLYTCHIHVMHVTLLA